MKTRSKIFVHTSRGYSLVELMAVVAILGFLASMAMSSFFVYTIKAKRVEVYNNLNLISKLVDAYKIANEGSIGYTYDTTPGYYARASLPPTQRANFGHELSTDDVSDRDSCYHPNKYGFRIKNCKRANYKYRVLFKTSSGTGPTSDSDGSWGIEAPATINLCGKGIFDQERWAYCPGTGTYCKQWDVLLVPGQCDYPGGRPDASSGYVTECEWSTCFLDP